MLACAGFGDDTCLAHFPGKEDLAEAVIDLVGSGMIEIFPLEIDLRSSKVLGHLLRIVQKGRTVRVIIEKIVQLRRKLRVILVMIVSFLQVDQLIHQSFRHILPSELPESAIRVCHVLPPLVILIHSLTLSASLCFSVSTPLLISTA